MPQNIIVRKYPNGQLDFFINNKKVFPFTFASPDSDLTEYHFQTLPEESSLKDIEWREITTNDKTTLPDD